MMLLAISLMCTLVYIAYAWATMLQDVGRWMRPGRSFPLLRRIRLETKPFRYAAIIGMFAPDIFGGRLSGWDVLSLALGLWFCWISRHDEDDDDRWKKRREKLASKVSVVGGRLQVVPQGDPS